MLHPQSLNGDAKTAGHTVAVVTIATELAVIADVSR
jgi:hypothetical protein